MTIAIDLPRSGARVHLYGARRAWQRHLVPARPQLEASAREALGRGDHARVAELVIEGYGPEILGWLAAVEGSADRAEEVFSRFSSLLWAALPRFRGDSSLRTWAYAIARHAQLQAQRVVQRARAVPLDDAPLSRLEARVRTETRPYLQTALKDKLAEARARLAPDDRALLVLRLDRGLSWSDVARVLGGDQDDDAAQRAHAARLRKRFERLKAELREVASREGWIPADE